MRSSETGGSMGRDPRQGFLRALKLATALVGIGLVVSASGVAAWAADDDDDDMTFEEKIIDNLMTGLGAKSMGNKPGIEYRERSPLVVPPSLDLPPPATEAKAAPNWPKDPDEKRRKEAIAQRKKGKPSSIAEAARPLTPAELNAGRTAAPAREAAKDSVQPGVTNNPMLSPSQLGYSGGLWNMMKGVGGTPEEKKFTSEPPRQSLVEPPPGYQTPSPNYAYGAGKDTTKKTYFDIMSGKDKEQ